MWAMLLWALTMPGHEVMVYDYLVQGSVSEAALRFKSAGSDQEGQSLKPQNVQAFTDAQSAPVLVIKQAKQIAPLLLLPLFAIVKADASPTYASPVSPGQLLQFVLPASAQPNAP